MISRWRKEKNRAENAWERARKKKNNRPKISRWTTSVYKTKNLFRAKQAWKSTNEKNEQRMGWAIKIIERRNERSCREGGGWSICTFVYIWQQNCIHNSFSMYFLLDFWWYFWVDFFFFVVAFLSAQCCSRQRIIPVWRCHLKWTQRVYSSYRKCICIWKITKMYI